MEKQDQPSTKKRPFPKRETLPGGHSPDQDGRTDYGKDKETTYPE
ncbi:hypothetical protein Desaci_0589 [Desulfosporosinus acidiphilus SJ4]|uniref:Uncharacterized protein n=1 Tax=Desulfosporosinus acidiphilus (strain DSM 22704 / JCM 16185 / SJ4) TaxID=646529 RepID=I4D1H7_DESAJ|nr:hypothetical protein [Desulfosporosinus acidiphilus]AFM39651.1 hypothetical protein Desaci_0589 [Desulfosporosinus acidiphilus SJ4]